MTQSVTGRCGRASCLLPIFDPGTSRESSSQFGSSWFGARGVASYNAFDSEVHRERTAETLAIEKERRGSIQSYGIFPGYRNKL